jgi:hypothetical protein
LSIETNLRKKSSKIGGVQFLKIDILAGQIAGLEGASVMLRQHEVSENDNFSDIG